MSNDRTLSTGQLAALGEALQQLEHGAMNTLRRTDPNVPLLLEDSDSEVGTVHEAIATLVSDLHAVYTCVAPLGVNPLYPEWEG